MALTYVERHNLINSTQFLGRVEVAIVKYAVYLRNTDATGALGRFAKDAIEQQDYRNTAVNWLKWYVLENTAAAGTLTGSGDTLDSSATDAEISGQVEVQIQNYLE